MKQTLLLPWAWRPPGTAALLPVYMNVAPHTSGIIELAYCERLTSGNTWLQGSSVAYQGPEPSLLFKTEYYPTIQTDHTFWFIHSSVSGHLGHFHLLEERCLYKCTDISEVSIFSPLGFAAG